MAGAITYITMGSPRDIWKSVSFEVLVVKIRNHREQICTEYRANLPQSLSLQSTVGFEFCPVDMIQLHLDPVLFL